jgi:hypothetical protein
MALLRFSTPSAWVRSSCCVALAESEPSFAVLDARVRRVLVPDLASGYPRRPRLASPFRVFSPSQIGAGCPALAFLGLPAPRSHADAVPLQGLAPWTECLAGPGGTAGYSLGVLPSKA